MGNGPAPYPNIGKRAKDLLTKDYNYDHKFLLSLPSSTGMGLVATGSKINQFFVGDISTEYKSGNTAVNVKVNTSSNISTKVTINDVLSGMNAACSFDIPDHKSGKLDVHYLHHRAAICSSIGLHPAPLLELSAVIGDKGLALGGEVGLDTASSSFTKYNAGISFNRPDFSAALILLDKGQTLKASYIQSVSSLSGTELAAEMSHSFTSSENKFTFGSSHMVDPLTMVKARFSNDGKVAMLCQREWRPKSLITVSAEHDTKAVNATPKLGITLALKP